MSGFWIPTVIRLIHCPNNGLNHSPVKVVFNDSHRSHLLVHLVFGRHGEVDDRLHIVLLQGQALDQAVVRLEVGVLERLRFVSLQLQLSGKQIQWGSEYS